MEGGLPFIRKGSTVHVRPVFCAGSLFGGFRGIWDFETRNEKKGSKKDSSIPKNQGALLLPEVLFPVWQQKEIADTLRKDLSEIPWT